MNRNTDNAYVLNWWTKAVIRSFDTVTHATIINYIHTVHLSVCKLFPYLACLIKCVQTENEADVLFCFLISFSVRPCDWTFRLEEQMIVHRMKLCKLVLVSAWFSCNFTVKNKWLWLVFNQTEWDYTKIINFQLWAHLIRSHSIRFLLTQSIDLNIFYLSANRLYLRGKFNAQLRVFFFSFIQLRLFTIYGIRHTELIP